MELARVHLKLSGLTQNVVVKHNVTPAQLSVYAFMHGEDCVESLTVTGIDKKRVSHQEMNRLRGEFRSEHATKALLALYPGAAPQLPTSFQAVGFDPEMLVEDGVAAPVARPQNQSEATIAQKIKEENARRKLAEKEIPLAPAPVDPEEIADALLDDTGEEDIDDDGEFDMDDDDDDDFSLTLGDDPIDAELRRQQEQPALPDAPAVPDPVKE